MKIHSPGKFLPLFIFLFTFLVIFGFVHIVNSADSIPFQEGDFHFETTVDGDKATESIFTNEKAASNGNVYIATLSGSAGVWMQMLVLQDSREVKIKQMFLKKHDFSGKFAKPLFFLQFPLKKGAQLTTETTFGITTDKGVVDMKVKYVSSIEDIVKVEVPAGVFDNCFQIRTYMETEKGSGSAVWWYHPSAGFVKIIEEGQPNILHLLTRYELKK